MRRTILIFILLMLPGCVASYRQSTVIEPTAKLVKGSSVLIATPKNGSYKSTEYPSSGKMAALAIQAAFGRHATAAVSSECNDLSCMKGKTPVQYGYYVVPEIVRWEDRATEWSGMPDTVEMKISIYDGQTSMNLASAIIYGKSKSFTFGSLPEELLPEPIKKYVDSLY